MENFNKKFTETSLRIGEVRFSYVNVFSPRKNEDGTPGKYSVQLLIPKSNKQGLKMIEEAMEAAKQKGKTDKWGGKIPARMQSVLRDGDEEHPDEEVYEGMMFMITNTASMRKAQMIYQMYPDLTSEQYNVLFDDFNVGKTVRGWAPALIDRKLAALGG